jgi:hypothetical protein
VLLLANGYTPKLIPCERRIARRGGRSVISFEIALRLQAACRLTLDSAIEVSFLSVAFSSSRFCCSTLAQSLRPSCLAQAIKLP